MDIPTQRVAAPRVPWRALGVLALIAVLLAATIGLLVGTQRRVPAPFGPAANGAIVYSVLANTGDFDVRVRDTIDGAERVLIGGPTDDHDPFFDRTGSRLFFVRTIDDLDYLMAARPDGSAVMRLMDQPLRTDSLDVAPDGSAIAVINEESGFQRLMVIATDGSGGERIAMDGLVPISVSWHPSGERLLLRAQENGTLTYGLYTMDVDGSSQIDLGAPAPGLFGAGSWDLTGSTWSPTGRQIAFNVPERDPRDGRVSFRVHLIDADGTGERPVAPPVDPAVQESWPRYSPDGTMLLVHRWVWREDGPLHAGWLAVMPSDGSEPARDIGPKIPGGEATALVMRWSPDGTRVLVRAENTAESYSIDPTSGEFQRLAWNAISLPDWQRVVP